VSLYSYTQTQMKMKFIKKLAPLAIFALAFGLTSFASADTACVGTGSECSVTTDVSVEVIAGDICIGTTGSLDLGTVTASASPQTVTATFADEFWVEDLKGADSGYYTTLQLSGSLADLAGNTIAATDVSVRSTGGVSLMNGSANANVVLDAGMAGYQSLDSARTFIKRDTAANSGLVGQYGAFPEIQINVPAYQAIGTYTATLTYTLYEN